MLLHTIGNFERISDHACNLTDAARQMYEKKLEFSDKAKKELDVLQSAVMRIVNISFDSFEKKDEKEAERVEPLEQVIDDINMELKARHIKRLREGRCTLDLGFILSDITTNLERVSDHCSNIAVCLIQIKHDGFDTHEYLDTIKREDNAKFKERFMQYQKQYALPKSNSSPNKTLE